MKLSEVLKQYGFNDPVEIQLYAGVKRRTLYDWFNNKPQSFRAIVLGAAIIRDYLDLPEKEIEHETIALLTQAFIEKGGVIDVIKTIPADEIEPKIRVNSSDL